MEKVVRLISLILFLCALLFAYAGYAHRAPYGQADDESLALPVAGAVAGKIGDIAKDSLSLDLRTSLGNNQNGLLLPLGGAGGIFLALAVGVFLLSARLTRIAQEKDSHRISWDHEEDQFDHNTQTKVKISAIERYKMEIDDSLLKEKPKTEEEKIFENLETVIALSHSTLEKGQILTIIRVLRPDIMKFLDLMTEVARERIAKQILSHYILSQKRAEKKISADQFRLQDERTNELARQTIVRRLIPKRPENIPPETANSIGRIYDLSEQPGVQQKSGTQVEDWQDISLRNIVDMMRVQPPVAPVAAMPPPAAGEPAGVPPGDGGEDFSPPPAPDSLSQDATEK